MITTTAETQREDQPTLINRRRESGATQVSVIPRHCVTYHGAYNQAIV